MNADTISIAKEVVNKTLEYCSTHTFNFDINKDKTPEQLKEEFDKAYYDYLEREFGIIIKEVKEE